MSQNNATEAGLPGGRVTRAIADFAAGTRWDDIPDAVRHEAKRSILNGFATALAGCREPAIDKMLATMMPYSGKPGCSIIGRAERTDALLAANVNAMSANIFDFDDTHPATIIHPTAPVAPALFAMSETRKVTGRQLLHAFIIGAEIECRLGNAVSPYHYARGWHITSTCGVFGAAMAAGVLLGLTEEQHCWSLGNASVQSSGMVESLGTMSKSIGVGNAARNGLVSALLASEGFSGPAAPLEGQRGFLSVYADSPDHDAILGTLGASWEIAKNTYKPYPVGVVLNPVIEACLDLSKELSLEVGEIDEVELTGHPLLRQRADRPGVETGRESQVSAQHAIAIVLRRGKAGLGEFDDTTVAETERDGIRPDVRFVDDESYGIDGVKLVLRMRDGTEHLRKIKDTVGSSRNPMSDQQLQDKLIQLAQHSGFAGDVAALADALWSLDRLPDASLPVKLCASD